MSGRDPCNRFLCLGAGQGWHANQLRDAAAARDCELHFATYESLRARVDDVSGCSLQCEAGSVDDFDAILTRTMPAGTLEQITFRLATLHVLEHSGFSVPEPKALASDLAASEPIARTLDARAHRSRSPQIPLVNSPRSLEIAIDKFATLAHVAELGFSVPETIVVQSRREAIDAYHELGGDCIVKPIFGGEGRGVMRIQNSELAWTTFWTLEKLGAVAYIQPFVSPGGSDTRLLVIGDQVIGVRRENQFDFRTNVASGGTCQATEPTTQQIAMARRICHSIGLKFASVDLIDCEDGEPKVLEVNAIPGWKGAQRVCPTNIAERIIEVLQCESAVYQRERC